MRERERERRKSVTSFLGANMVYRRKAYRKFGCMHETDDMQHYEGTVGHYLP